MWSIHKSFLNTALLFMTVAAKEPIEYVLNHHCDQHIDVATSAILKVDNRWESSRKTCPVTITSQVGLQDNHVRLQVQHFFTDCGTSSVQLYDGHADTGTKMADLCGDVTPEDKMFLTQADRVTVVLNPHHNQYAQFTAKLLVTALTHWYGDSDFFQCDNDFNIDTRLHCDGYNNCGDQSDEGDCGTGWSLTDTCVLIGSTLGAGLLVCLLVLVIKMRISNRNVKMVKPAYGKSGVLPSSYGSIQGDNA